MLKKTEGKEAILQGQKLKRIQKTKEKGKREKISFNVTLRLNKT